MNTNDRPTALIWVPRILAILFILFFSMFALDVFTGGNILAELAGFAIHMIPSFIMAILLALFWRRPLYAGVAFLAVTVAIILYYRTYLDPLSMFMITSLPPLLIAGLFLLVFGLDRRQRAS